MQFCENYHTEKVLVFIHQTDFNKSKERVRGNVNNKRNKEHGRVKRIKNIKLYIVKQL